MYTLKTNEPLLREEIYEGYESVAHSRWLNTSKIREVENVNKKQETRNTDTHTHTHTHTRTYIYTRFGSYSRLA